MSITEQLLSELYKRQRSCGQPLRSANRDKVNFHVTRVKAAFLLHRRSDRMQRPLQRILCNASHGALLFPQTAAAAVYIAARMAQMPLTVVKVAAAIRTSTKAFGRAYQSAVAALGIRVPAVPPQVFLQFGAQSLCHDPSAQVGRPLVRYAWCTPEHAGNR